MIVLFAATLAIALKFPWPIWIYLGMSLLTLIVYFMDKSRATGGRWRINEWTLHLLEMLGGWPGAFLGQRVFRHKYRKMDYMLVYWAIVTVHVVFWIWQLGWLRR